MKSKTQREKKTERWVACEVVKTADIKTYVLRWAVSKKKSWCTSAAAVADVVAIAIIVGIV